MCVGVGFEDRHVHEKRGERGGESMMGDWVDLPVLRRRSD